MRRLLVAVFAVALLATACGDDAGNVFSIDVGTCFDDEGVGEVVENVPIVDCAEPHDNEVYHLFDLADGDFPGRDSLIESASVGCVDAFDGFVGADYLESELEISFLTPTSESWGAGDREVVCYLFQIQLEKLTGSMQGSGR